MERQFAEQYGDLETWHWWFRGRQRILETVLCREVGGQTSLSIASLGCGPVEGLNWLASFARPNGRVVGVDSDPIHARSVKSNIDCVVGKVDAVPLVSESFDVVLALDVLEHLHNDTAALYEAVRLLKPDGLLLVTVPALPSLWGVQDVANQHRRRYTKRALKGAFAQAQLPSPQVTYFNTILFPPLAAVRWFRRSVGLAPNWGSDFDGNRPGVINDFLAAVFSFERYLIRRVPLPVGVSLLATVRRNPDRQSFQQSLPN
jgi:SAM-dependent methyltransferase